jgi:hypothetical protein
MTSTDHAKPQNVPKLLLFLLLLIVGWLRVAMRLLGLPQGLYSKSMLSDSRIYDSTMTKITCTRHNFVFGGCLLYMDDNHRLIEWLAYHSFVLPLKHLVIAIDPRSHTNPSEILQRYQRILHSITVWTDEETLGFQVHPNDPLGNTYLFRQRQFIPRCNTFLRNHTNATHVVHVDTDEFVVPIQNTSTTFLKEYGSITSHLQKHSIYNQSCLAMPRLLFSSKLMSVNTTNNSAFYHELDTLRYRYHAPRRDGKLNGLVKVMILIQQIPYQELQRRAKSPHMPVRGGYCPSPHVTQETLLRVHHYLGSWESYAARDDARRGKERTQSAWYRKNEKAAAVFLNDSLNGWIEGFVKHFGPQTAQNLLQGAGRVKTKHTQGLNWNYTIKTG